MGGCEWFTNFTRQPKIDPWEVATMDSSRLAKTPPRGNPQGSVPIYGGSPPSFVVSYGIFPATIDSMSAMRNPTPVSAASLANGHKYYAINCAVCHGDTGDGNGALARYPFPRISLLTPTAMGYSDGYIYGMIRNGRGSMPPYNRIEHMDRWDVVNYVRGLQGRAGQTVPTGPVGQPGETGDKVPGPSVSAPTRPVPYWHPDSAARGGADTTARPVGGAAIPAGTPPPNPPSGTSGTGVTPPPGGAR
jgi:mono/diheme cytochrome c family protein